MCPLSNIFFLVEMIKFEKCFFQFMPEPLVQISALAGGWKQSIQKKKWKESCPTRVSLGWVDQSLLSPATRENKFTKITPALIPSWNMKFPTVFPPYRQEPKSSNLSSTLITSSYQTGHQENLFNQQKIS